jgi:hypothetical protein
MRNIRTPLSAVAVALVAFAGSGAANAAGTDFSSLTSAVDFSSVATAILAIAALLVVPAVVKKGARIVLSMIGR